MSGRCLVGARVHPMTRPDATAEAIAWHDGKIVAVGDRRDVVRVARGLGIEPEDLAGRTVLPGFVDAHMHFLHVGVRLLRPDLRGAQSLRDAEARTQAWLDAHPGEEPVIAEGWDESAWPDRRFPTRDDLDALSPDRPLVWRRQDGHVAVANSAALPAIRARWPDASLADPESGLLVEDASLYLNEVIAVPPDQLDRALDVATDIAHEEGVTAIGEYAQWPFREAYLRAAADGRLRLRVACSIYAQDLERATSEGFQTGRARSAWLRDGGVKVFLDGSFGARTAFMRTPYADTADGPPTRGRPNWTSEALTDLFGQAHAAGIQVHAHAIGDAAIDQGLEAFATLEGGRPAHDAEDARRTPRPGGMHDWRDTGEAPKRLGTPLRHRFEHYELPQNDALDRTVELGTWACAQPNFVGVWSAGGGMYERRIGPVFRLNNRYRTWLDRGLQFCFGSDGMPFGPRTGLLSAVRHPVPQQRISAQRAVWLYTARAAQAIHWEDAIGTLAPGMDADLLILDAPDLDGKRRTMGRPDARTTEPAIDLAATARRRWPIHATIVDGKTAWTGDAVDG